MVITELTLQDVLRIKTVRISPDGNVVKISGRNAQGKSSILTGIELVLRGPSSFPEKPIRDGCDQGAGRIETDELIITRHISPHRLVITRKGSDEKIKRPQQFLDELLNKYTCDPLKLLNLSAPEQLEEVKRILGLDFAGMEKEYDELYEARRDLNRDAKALKSLTKGFDENSPVNQIDDSDLLDKHSKAREINTANAKLRFELDNERDKVKSLKKDEAKIEEQLRAIRGEIAERTESGKALAKQADGLVDLDEAELFDEIQRVQKHNSEVSKNKEIVGFVIELNDNVVSVEKANARMEEIKELKASAIRDAEFSVDGLSIDDNSLMYNGIPLSQSSQSEQLRVCMALSVAGKPEISVVLMRQASLLDKDNLKLVAEMAEEMNFQVWLEVVGEDDELSFVIEDGSVKSSPDGDVVGQEKLF